MATVLIIGASRGIGHEFVHQYRADNWDVIGTARDEAGLAKLKPSNRGGGERDRLAVG